MKSINYICILLLFFMASCDQQGTQPNSENNLIETHGMMKLNLDMTDAPSEVIRLEGKLYRDNSEEIPFDLDISENTASAFVENIPIGNWTLRIDAFNDDNVIIYTGTSEVTVNPGVLTSVTIRLNAAMGSLQITVTWGDQEVGLIAYYPFNGNANDESDHNNHGVVHGATLTEDKSGNANSAYDFNGVNTYIQIPYSSDFDFSQEREISFGYWIYLRALHYEYNVAFGKDAPCGYFAYALDPVENRKVEAAIHGSGCWILAYSPQELELNEWYHLFATANDDKLKLYINGEKVIEVPTVYVDWDRPYTGNTYIGAWGGIINMPLDQFIDGVIDEVRLYNRTLTDDEVLTLYQEY